VVPVLLVKAREQFALYNYEKEVHKKMNNTFNTKELADWIEELQYLAKNDENFLVSWFKPTEDLPISIVGGWLDGYDSVDADLFCLSKSNPTYGMSIKIVVNEGPYAYCDFETLDMPLLPNDEVDDTILTLEWTDNPAAVASFFASEWERIMEAHENGAYING
jgi:hypothetical protein